MESFDGGDVVLGGGATRAWLHVYLPGAGWVPFDPTNSIFGGTDLIRVAYTRTPGAGGPGFRWLDGLASDYIGITVKVSVRRIAAETALGLETDASGEPCPSIVRVSSSPASASVPPVRCPVAWTRPEPGAPGPGDWRTR